MSKETFRKWMTQLPRRNAEGRSLPDSFWTNIFARRDNEQRDILKVLHQIPVFHNMNQGQVREFERIIHRRSFKADETIFYEGEPGVGMYVIQDGKVGIFKKISDQERELLAELTSGDFFGEVALLDESPRSATAIAIENTRVLGLFRPDLLELIERKPRLGNHFLLQLARVLGERLRAMNHDLQELRVELTELNRRLQPEEANRSEMIL